MVFLSTVMTVAMFDIAASFIDWKSQSILKFDFNSVPNVPD
jgi:hypothetical protein